MRLVPFPEFLEGEGKSFGLSPPLLLRILDGCSAGLEADQAMGELGLQAVGLAPEHLLTLRRQARRYLRLQREAHSLQGLADAFALRGRMGLAIHALANKGEAKSQAWVRALGGLAQATLQRGLIHFHVRKIGDASLLDLDDLLGRSLACDELPPHRWFKARRAAEQDLLWLEVRPPAAELDELARQGLSRPEQESVIRAVDKPVLDALSERAEGQVLRQAAQGMLDLLGRAPLPLPVAGGLLERRGLVVCLWRGSDVVPEVEEFADGRHLELAPWLRARGLSLIGLARKDAGSGAAWLQALTSAGLAVEWVRMAGLMKQARRLAGPIKAAAAQWAARRLADPLDGYESLEPDELGLGEYLDLVDGELLHGALADARRLARWRREQGRAVRPVARGAVMNPMVRSLADVHAGMEFAGTVINLTGFGAFVELGLEVQGLIHLSEMSEDFVRHPAEVVTVGQRVRVRVLKVEPEKGRLSLSLKLGRQAGREKGRPRRAETLKALDELFKKG